jgi:hypothetical protein
MGIFHFYITHFQCIKIYDVSYIETAQKKQAVLNEKEHLNVIFVASEV